MHAYAIGCDDGLVKFGWARNPSARLKSLQIGSPVKLTLWAVKDCGNNDAAKTMEMSLHERFKHERSHGEWFRVQRESVAHAFGCKTEELGTAAIIAHVIPAKTAGCLRLSVGEQRLALTKSIMMQSELCRTNLMVYHNVQTVSELVDAIVAKY